MSEQTETTKKKAKKSKAATPKSVKRELEVKLSESEVLKRLEELLDASQARDALRSLKSEQTSNINAEIKLAEQRVRDLNAALRNKKEKREVDCIERMVFATNTVEIIRTDTNEIVEKRAMTPDERQPALFDAPKPGEPLTATVAEVTKAKRGKALMREAAPEDPPCPKVSDKGEPCTRGLNHLGAHGYRDAGPKA